jgi:hypothetical protein
MVKLEGLMKVLDWKRSLVCLCGLTISLICAGCSYPSRERTTGEPVAQNSQKPLITREAAVNIAKARVATDIDLGMTDVVATEEPERWAIQSNRRPEFRDWTGGEGLFLWTRKAAK